MLAFSITNSINTRSLISLVENTRSGISSFIHQLRLVRNLPPDRQRERPTIEISPESLSENGLKAAAKNMQIELKDRGNNLHQRVASRLDIRQFEQSKKQVLNGEIQTLVGRGVIATSSTQSRPIPIAFDYIGRNDKLVLQKMMPFSPDIVRQLVKTFDGTQTQAADIVPGMPCGNYFNLHQFGEDLKLIEVSPGQNDASGIRIKLSEMPDNIPLLIHGGTLSASTIIYAQKGDYLYVYHAGPKASDSNWMTCTDGAQAIMDSHCRLTHTDMKNVMPDKKINNQFLVDFLSENYNQVFVNYAGMTSRPDSMLTQAPQNVSAFNYNEVSSNDPGAGNAMMLLLRQNGSIKMETLSDSLSISLASHDALSISHQIVSSEFTHL